MGPLPEFGIRHMLGFLFVALVLGGALSHILPWLWGMAKPLIHALTG